MTGAVVLDHFGRFLDELGFRTIAADRHAAGIAMERHVADEYSASWRRWGDARTAVAKEQLTYRWCGIEAGAIDGLVGPQTRYARDAYLHWLEHGTIPAWRDVDPVLLPNGDRPRLPAASAWPDQRDCPSYYGSTRAEVEARLTYVECPWDLRLAWDLRTTTRRIRIHERCAASLGEVLAAVSAGYSLREIRSLRLDRYGGSYIWRLMRGGTRLSMHAYGCAIDWDPERNGLRTRWADAAFSRPEYEHWWQCWEAAGWVSLGRARGYDAMHVQAALL